MRKNYWWITCAVLLLSITIISWKSDNKASTAASSSSRNLFENYVDELYQAANLSASGLDEAVFQKAVTGFINLKADNMISPFSSILTVIDYNRPSHEKRMWIVDMVNETLLLNTWVAHGQGSGVDTASTFSNTDNSHQSSLGFYLTDDIYFGKHGRSLHLDGLDEGFNSSARQREIVVHAADYVSQSFIDQNGRIGRSWGCPAVAPEVAGTVIDDIKGKTVIYINGNDASYTSKYLDEDLCANYVFPSGTVGGVMAAKF